MPVFRVVKDNNTYVLRKTFNKRESVNMDLIKALQATPIKSLMPIQINQIKNDKVINISLENCYSVEVRIQDPISAVEGIMLLKGIVDALGEINQFGVAIDFLDLNLDRIFVKPDGNLSFVTWADDNQKNPNTILDLFYTLSTIFQPRMKSDSRFLEKYKALFQQDLNTNEEFMDSILEFIGEQYEKLEKKVLSEYRRKGNNIEPQGGRNEEVEHLKKVITQKDEKIESLSQQFPKLNEQIDDLNKELQRKNQQIEYLKQPESLGSSGVRENASVPPASQKSILGIISPNSTPTTPKPILSSKSSENTPSDTPLVETKAPEKVQSVNPTLSTDTALLEEKERQIQQERKRIEDEKKRLEIENLKLEEERIRKEKEKLRRDKEMMQQKKQQVVVYEEPVAEQTSEPKPKKSITEGLGENFYNEDDELRQETEEPDDLLSAGNTQTTVLMAEDDDELVTLHLINKRADMDFELVKEQNIVGKNKRFCHVIVPNDPSVSSKHAEIDFYQDEGKAFIKDLNSTNGTFVNGKRIGSNLESALNEGTHLRLGKTEFVVHFEQM